MVDTTYDSASKRWPDVRWPKAAFAQHVARHRTRTRAKFGEDLFLAGAAGHGDADAWRIIDRDFGPGVRAYLGRRGATDQDPDDLWQAAASRLLDSARPSRRRVIGATSRSGQPRLLSYAAMTSLTSHLITVSVRIAISRRRTRKGPPKSTPLDLVMNACAADPTATTSPGSPSSPIGFDAGVALARRVEAAVNALDVETRVALKLVYFDGMPRAVAGQLVGWTPSTTTRRLQRATAFLNAAIVPDSTVRDGRAPAFECNAVNFLDHEKRSVVELIRTLLGGPLPETAPCIARSSLASGPTRGDSL